jgi:hypothetical protein
MDNYNKDTIIEIYVEWLTTSTVTFFQRTKLDGKRYGFLLELEVRIYFGHNRTMENSRENF